MRRRIAVRIVASIVLALGIGVAAYDPGEARARTNAEAGSYAPVNGVEMYYEIHGEGSPLVLIHGGLGGIAEFGQLVPRLAETRQVIAVELQAHGHTPDIDRPLSFEYLADDVASLIEYLGLDDADVLGFSLGGGVALQTAIRHPDVVRRLVLVSTAFRQSGIHAEFLAGMTALTAEAAQQMTETPMYIYYASVAPTPDAWPTLVGKMGDLHRQDYDWSSDVGQITAPTLVIAGDSDFIPPSYSVELFGLLGGGVAGGYAAPSASQFAVLPNATHFGILYRTDELLSVVTPFLDAPVSAAQ